MGFLSGLFGGKAPKAPDPMQTAQQASQLSQGNQLWNAQQQWSQNQKTGPFGGVYTDPTTGAQTQQFGSAIQPAVSNTTGALGAQTAGLPVGFDFSQTSAPGILMSGMNTYDALSEDPIRQGQNRISQEIANRGLPINDQISADLQGNFDRQNALARQSFFSDLYGRLPGIQATETNTAIAQGMAPGQQAGQSLGLLQGYNSLLPGYNPQYQFSSADPSQAFVNTTNANYKNALDQYNANQQGIGNLVKAGVGLALTPMTGGLSTTLLGTGLGALGGLFNNANPSPTQQFNANAYHPQSYGYNEAPM